MTDMLNGLGAADNSSALGELEDGEPERVAVPIPLSAITRCVQVCGVDAKPEEITSLAANIKEFGLLHPIEVNPNGDDTYTLIKGNSRRLAFQELGRETIPAFVDARTANDELMAVFIRAQASENAHRKQLTILETLNTIGRLADPPCSCSRNAIGRIMRLPEATLKRYWRVYRTVRDRGMSWLPEVAQWLNTPAATWVTASAFAHDRELEHRFAETGELPNPAPTPLPEPEPEREQPAGAPPAEARKGGQLTPLHPPADSPAPVRDEVVPDKPPTPPGRQLWRRLCRNLEELHSVVDELTPELRQEIGAALQASVKRVLPQSEIEPLTQKEKRCSES
ncbi:ParB/RepB/Spo0J family partition protein [Crossiella sp. CA198]|uniref:ParB/RepB/Spo0J family partition protein n=1 Tax=Crossiella sp. CA198 TaxID=3455607 RepID=UPI003F8D258A